MNPKWISLSLFINLPAFGQGGKTYLEWAKEYSPTGYFIINDYETRANKPGDHKQHLSVTTSPVGATAVHEICHMRNGMLSQNNSASFFIGNGKDYKFTRPFTPFNSKEMMPDIPASLENFQTDVYISGKAGTDGAYSQVGGLYGIFEEFDAYVTEVQATVEMAPCFKAHFNKPGHWEDLAQEITTSVWSNSEFRYFSLRYIMWAKKKHPDVYDKIMASREVKETYSHLVRFAEESMTGWIAVLTEQKMDTKTQNGFDWYWKFWNEIQKPEYKELEKSLLVLPVGLAPDNRIARRTSSFSDGMVPGRFDLRGRAIVPRQSGDGNRVLIRRAGELFIISP